MKKIKRRKKTTKKLAREIRRSAKDTYKEKKRVEFLSSGCITLNLSLSGFGLKGGWARGRIINIVGDGSSGKTLLALELCFWFFNNIKKIVSKIYPKVKKFHICYDNVEGVMDFPIEKMYGEEFVKSVDFTRSPHFESMCRRFLKKVFSLKKGESLIYVIDSWDSFQSATSKKAFLKSVKDDEELKGDYDLVVQKYASRKFFPTFCDALDENKIDVTLVIISQVRDAIGVMFGKKQKRVGGKALDFYTHQVAWIKEIEKLTKIRRGKKWTYGIKSAVKVERSKVSKPFREADFTILYDYGLDNISSQIDFLWGKKTISFNKKKFTDRKDFIKHIEKNNLEDKLARHTEKVWHKIEAEFEDEVKERKDRY